MNARARVPTVSRESGVVGQASVLPPGIVSPKKKQLRIS